MSLHVGELKMVYSVLFVIHCAASRPLHSSSSNHSPDNEPLRGSPGTAVLSPTHLPAPPAPCRTARAAALLPRDPTAAAAVCSTALCTEGQCWRAARCTYRRRHTGKGPVLSFTAHAPTVLVHLRSDVFEVQIQVRCHKHLTHDCVSVCNLFQAVNKGGLVILAEYLFLFSV